MKRLRQVAAVTHPVAVSPDVHHVAAVEPTPKRRRHHLVPEDRSPLFEPPVGSQDRGRRACTRSVSRRRLSSSRCAVNASCRFLRWGPTWRDSEATMASAGLPVVSPSRMRRRLPRTHPRARRRSGCRRRRRDLVDPIPQAGTVPDELSAQAPDLAQPAEPCGRDPAGGPQAELAAGGQPGALPDVGLAPPDLLDLLGVHEQRRDPGVFQGLEGCVPEDAGRFHDGGGDLMLKQPGDEIAPAARQGAEDPGEDLHLRAGRARRTLAVTCILCTSRPAARGWMRFRVSFCGIASSS